MNNNENQFCNDCGMLISDCTCGAKNASAPHSTPTQEPSPDAAPAAAPVKRAEKQKEASFISRFEKIALTQDEVVVRKYTIGQFAKGLRGAGTGEATVIITNKRVISKQSSECFGTSHTSVEELALENIAGVKNYFSQGITVWRLVAAGGLFLTGLPLLFEKTLIAIILLAAAAYMAHTCRKPSYLFSVYAGATGSAMTMGVNLRGKLFNSAGTGIVFQYKPTDEALNMMCEMGACIMDLKTKGNYAIEKWKKA